MQDQMARDFAKAFVFSKNHSAAAAAKERSLFDVCFLVGQGKAKTRLYGVRSILGVRSRHVQKMSP